MKKFALMLLCAMLILAGSAAAEGQIVATSFPCYDLARQVAGEEAEVSMLIRPGTEVHNYEPSPSDILSISDADLFVCIGGESDEWVDNILSSLEADAPTSIKLMDSVTLLEEEGEHEDEDEHDETEMDEHIWTSPKNALLMLRAVEDALCEAIPESAEVFHENADAYAAEIENLDAALTELVENALRTELIFADRFPFLYLVTDYGLTYKAAFASCTTETEPSAQTIVEIIETIQSDQIPVVYIIEMSNGSIAETIQEETGVEILQLHSCQTVTQDEFDAGETYVSLMQNNLEALEKGLN